jgi:TIR domain
MGSEPKKALEVFFSYSHKDQALRDQLEAHLSLLKNQGFISSWHDRKIIAGTEWAGEIDAHLNSAQIILLLISADFLASTYCYGIEVARAIERHNAGEAIVIPIILRPCDWHSAPFGKLQALPTDGKPVTGRSWHDLDEAFYDVATGIQKAVRELTMHSGMTRHGRALKSASR